MATEPPAKKARVEGNMTLTYFPLFAKGLAPALCAELSGVSWKGNKDTGFEMAKWDELKATGKAPFGQLPLLEVNGMNIGQSLAIVNYIGRVSGLEGKDDAEFATSQMLLAEGEDLYTLMQKHQPTIMAGYGQRGKLGPEENKVFWDSTVPAEMAKLEKLLGTTAGDSFTSTGTTVGELYLFAMMHQMKLCSPDFLKGTPGLLKFYEATLALPAVKKVLDGESAMGELKAYFISPTN